MIENEQVWEAPPEATDRRVLIATEGQTIMLGTYYETPEELETFNQVLATFQFIP